VHEHNACFSVCVISTAAGDVFKTVWDEWRLAMATDITIRCRHSQKKEPFGDCLIYCCCCCCCCYNNNYYCYHTERIQSTRTENGLKRFSQTVIVYVFIIIIIIVLSYYNNIILSNWDSMCRCYKLCDETIHLLLQTSVDPQSKGFEGERICQNNCESFADKHDGMQYYYNNYYILLIIIILYYIIINYCRPLLYTYDSGVVKLPIQDAVLTICNNISSPCIVTELWLLYAPMCHLEIILVQYFPVELCALAEEQLVPSLNGRRQS